MTMTVCEEVKTTVATVPPSDGEAYVEHLNNANAFFELRDKQAKTIQKAYLLWTDILEKPTNTRTPCEETFCFQMKGYERKYQLRRGTVTSSGVYAVATSMRALEQNMSPLPWTDQVAKKVKPGKSWAEKCLERQIKRTKAATTPGSSSNIDPIDPITPPWTNKTISKTKAGVKMVLTAPPKSSVILSDAVICDDKRPSAFSAMPPKKRPGALAPIDNRVGS